MFYLGLYNIGMFQHTNRSSEPFEIEIRIPTNRNRVSILFGMTGSLRMCDNQHYYAQ